MPWVQGRRVFLRSAAGLALGLPFLPSLLPRQAKAGLEAAPRRFIAIHSGSGQMVTDCWPTATPANYELRDAVYDADRSDGTTALRADQLIGGAIDQRRAPLSDFAGAALTRTLGTDLEAYYDKLILARGIDYMSGIGHNNGGMLGNYKAATGGQEIPSHLPTIDQILAASPKFYETTPTERMLHLSTGFENSMSYAEGSSEPTNSRSNPLDVWQNYFEDFVAPDNGPHPNIKLINAVYGDYTTLMQSARLSAADRMVVDRHMTYIDDIERRLAETVDCTKPEAPTDFSLNPQVTDPVAFENAVELLVRMATVAIRCDLTRIVTINVSMALAGAGAAVTTSLHNSDGVQGDWHDFAHAAATEASKREQLVNVNRWVALSVFKRLLEELDVEETGGETFLDNSLVYWGGELSLDHYSTGMPTVLAGGAGGRIDTGYYVDYTQLNGDYANPGLQPWGCLIPGMPHNRLLVTILQAMGLSPEDYERDGLPGYGHNVVTGNAPYGLPADAYDYADLDKPLPGIAIA